LELIARLPIPQLTEQLWYLLCSLVQSSFSVVLEDMESTKPENERNPRKKGSPTMTFADRFQNYAAIAEEILDTYPETTIGSFVLRKTYINPDSDIAEWHPNLHRKFVAVKEKCRRDLPKWMMKGGRKLFTEKERKTLDERAKVMVYIGSKINEAILAADSMANTHVNKHWPYELKSGQSPSG
jgi:hypothetical protein